MSGIYNQTITAVQNSMVAFCRYITANDIGETGSHQSGFYIPKYAIPVFFDTPGEKGTNKDRNIIIKWQNEFETSSRVIYYGKGTRNEYRITRFGKHFPFFTDDNIGNLLIIAKHDNDIYSCFVLSEDDDIDSFFAHFNIPPDSGAQLIEQNEANRQKNTASATLQEIVAKFSDFPQTEIMTISAQSAAEKICGIDKKTILSNPDDVIIKWIDIEFALFRMIEEKVYNPIISKPFSDCQSLIDFSNTILNRRKSRAGKSLEHHLAKIFMSSELKFETQVVTEDNKKPDFIFPGGKEYHDFSFPAEKLIFLGAKTTCKDRWRQVLNEADRIDKKYLFTLQQGVSSNQLKEMKHENLILVVPEQYRTCFSREYRDDILSLKNFVNMVRLTQN